MHITTIIASGGSTHPKDWMWS